MMVYLLLPQNPRHTQQLQIQSTKNKQQMSNSVYLAGAVLEEVQQVQDLFVAPFGVCICSTLPDKRTKLRRYELEKVPGRRRIKQGEGCRYSQNVMTIMIVACTLMSSQLLIEMSALQSKMKR